MHSKSKQIKWTKVKITNRFKLLNEMLNEMLNDNSNNLEMNNQRVVNSINSSCSSRLEKSTNRERQSAEDMHMQSIERVIGKLSNRESLNCASNEANPVG